MGEVEVPKKNFADWFDELGKGAGTTTRVINSLTGTWSPTFAASLTSTPLIFVRRAGRSINSVLIRPRHEAESASNVLSKFVPYEFVAPPTVGSSHPSACALMARPEGLRLCHPWPAPSRPADAVQIRSLRICRTPDHLVRRAILG